MTRKACTAILFITLASVPVQAYGLEAKEPCKALESESPSKAFVRCSTEMQKVTEKAENGEVSPEAKTMVRAVAKKALDEAGTQVFAQASSADAADASGSRVSDSLADLLPLLQGAVTPANTSGDGVPVVLNFNSPPFLRGKTSLQAVLSEPTLFAPLEKKFTEADRDNETKALLDRAGGFGDTTYTLGWSPDLRAGNWSTTRQLFGREPKTYLPLINEYADDVLLPELLPEYTAKVDKLLKDARKNLREPAKKLASQLGVDPDVVYNDLTFFQLREKAGATADPESAIDLVDQIEKAVNDLSILERDAQDTLDARDKLDERFAALVGNQPELQVRASFRDADTAVGPRDYALSVVYAAGSRNFNSLLDDYRGLIKQRPDTSGEIKAEERRKLKKQAFDELTERALNSDWWRMTYAITYKKIDDYDETFEDTLDDGIQKLPIPLKVSGVAEWQLRLNYSQLAGPDFFNADARPRLAFAVEGTWVQEDGDIPEALRRQDRLVGRITYTVPSTDNLTFPVSIVFANHPEFLSEDKDLKNRLSAHVGLSYKLAPPRVAKPAE